MLLKVGDKVIWRGGWGSDAPAEATVQNIDLVVKGEKYGVEVPSIPWAIVADHAVVTLDNGHWAYGYQISEASHAIN